MYVKMLDGPFVGQLRDLRSDVAIEFLRDGRATRAFADVEAPGPVPSDLVPPAAAAAAPVKKVRR